MSSDIKAIRKIVGDMLQPLPEVATVRRVTPNGADIQLADSGRYLRDVPSLRGADLEVGDYVVVLRTKSAEAQWIIIGASQTQFRGQPDGSGTTVVPAPSAVTATGRDDHIEVFWPGAKVDSVVGYELQHNTSGSAAGATNVVLRTNQYDYYAAQGTTRFFRARTVGKNYIRSGWTSWTSATVAGVAFLDLTDTQASYAGHASDVPMVNPAEDNLLFTALTFLNLADTDTSYSGHASEVPVVPPGESRLSLTALVFLALGDTPNTYAGQACKALVVNFAGNAVGFTTAFGRKGEKETLTDIWNFSESLNLKVDESNFTAPPTDAELDTAFGTPAQVGNGFLAWMDDAGGHNTVRLVGTIGGFWFYSAQLVKAV